MEGEPVHNTQDYFQLITWVLIVIVIGMVAINQTLEFYYRAEFLKAPCALCLELNPEVSQKCFIQEEQLFPYINGTWAYTNGSIVGG